jgi:hypothetical protein
MKITKMNNPKKITEVSGPLQRRGGKTLIIKRGLTPSLSKGEGVRH